MPWADSRCVPMAWNVLAEGRSGRDPSPLQAPGASAKTPLHASSTKRHHAQEGQQRDHGPGLVDGLDGRLPLHGPAHIGEHWRLERRTRYVGEEPVEWQPYGLRRIYIAALERLAKPLADDGRAAIDDGIDEG